MIETDLENFISEWNNDNEYITVHTSGSTGKPKEFRALKKYMANSARLTCQFLGLSPNDTVLLCMPLQYIAGKMIVVRALVQNLQLICVEPSGHPLHDLTTSPVFAAMIPLQVYNSLQIPEEREILKQIKHLIIGGGAIDHELALQLKDFPNAVWSTYGMTETLSHIALRRLNGSNASDWYTPFHQVNISLSPENTLNIYAPQISPIELHTNDIAEINAQGKFRILGRKDNIINSGGIKIQIEQIETALHPYLQKDFIITSLPDKKFGESIVLLTEDTNIANIHTICSQYLPKYWIPKHIFSISHIPLTETHKPNRAKAKEIAATSHKKKELE